MRRKREDLLAIFKAGLERVNGRRATFVYLEAHPEQAMGVSHLVAIGKAASSMSQGAVDILGKQLKRGLVVTKEGHLEPELISDPRLVCLESSHPVPTQRSIDCGAKLVAFLKSCPSEERVIFLLSGGASSLVEVLADGLDLGVLTRLNRHFMQNDLSIAQINSVRRRVSKIKGGRLASYVDNRRSLVLLISDVPNDDPAVIGSGLMKPHSQDDGGWEFLLNEMNAELDKIKFPPPPSLELFDQITLSVVACLGDAKQACFEKARSFGYSTKIEPEFLSGLATEAAAMAVNTIRNSSSEVHIWGGETVMRLPPSPGKGGRNQHLALYAALLLIQCPGYCVLACGTDGTDGPTEYAGALVDSSSLGRGQANGADIQACLMQANSSAFLEASGDVITMGPTGTNVMDLLIVMR